MNPHDLGPTRAAILDAAATLLEDKGPEVATLRTVGEITGASCSTLYRHCAGKAALVRALVGRTLQQTTEQIRHGAERYRGVWQRLRVGYWVYIDYAVEYSHHYQLILEDVPVVEPDPGLEGATGGTMAAVDGPVAQTQGTGLLQPSPTHEIATAIWVLLRGLTALQIAGCLHKPRTTDDNEHLTDLLDLALERL